MTKRLLVALLIWGALSAHATTMVPMYLDDLTAVSQTVAYGKVIASRVEWDEGHTLLYTVYTVVPVEYLKGRLGASFELREPGGDLGDVGMMIAGVPRFETGEEAVLFVWTDPKGYHQVSAFEQGAVGITIDQATGAKTAVRAVALGSARQALAVGATQPATSRVLPQFLDQIRTSVAKTSLSRQ
jgi:hypothetical protein